MPWLRRIAANAARDHWRRVAARREESVDRIDTMVAPDDPADEALRRAEVRQMTAALRTESPQTVSLLAARAAGTPVEDLAERAGLTPAALKMRLSRARQRLRQRLARLSGEEPDE